MSEKYPLPNCLKKLKVPEKDFEHWLKRKATAHVRRDKKRGNKETSVPHYKKKILEAIEESKGHDYYTGQQLRWDLISKWDNAEAESKRGAYKLDFWQLPTIDHEIDRENPHAALTLRLCSWQVNDAKNDQTIDELLKLAKDINNHRFGIKRVRIVVLDDEPGILKSLESGLKHCNCLAEIFTFTDTEEALEELLRNDPDIFITDWNHPKIPCEELLLHLAKRDVKYPIFVISGYADVIKKEKRLKPYSDQGLKITLLSKLLLAEDLLGWCHRILALKPSTTS